jgi:hypothetical protein
MPKDNKANKPKKNDPKKSQGNRKKKGTLERIKEMVSKSSPGGFLISKSREQIDRVMENLK